MGVDTGTQTAAGKSSGTCQCRSTSASSSTTAWPSRASRSATGALQGPGRVGQAFQRQSPARPQFQLAGGVVEQIVRPPGSRPPRRRRGARPASGRPGGRPPRHGAPAGCRRPTRPRAARGRAASGTVRPTCRPGRRPARRACSGEAGDTWGGTGGASGTRRRRAGVPACGWRLARFAAPAADRAAAEHAASSGSSLRMSESSSDARVDRGGPTQARLLSGRRFRRGAGDVAERPAGGGGKERSTSGRLPTALIGDGAGLGGSSV